jgi:predicted chitinase
MNIQRERYSRHTVSEFSNHPLDRIYMFSRKTVLQITGRQNRLLITRIDYTGLLPEQSWMSLNVDRGTVLTADVAASRYVITMEME